MPQEIRIEDLTIQKVDYQWIQNCSKVKHLKKAIRLIEQDGDYFKQLKQACQTKLEKLDPSIAARRHINNIPQQQKENILKDIYEWQDSLLKKDKTKIYGQQDYEQGEQNIYLRQQEGVLTSQKKAILAQKQRIKGNQAIRSNDLDQALNHYTKSIQYDKTMASSYCNRSLIYLKKKDYQACIKDSTTALKINPNYVKALLRRAKANGKQNRLKDAASDLRRILQIQPDCKQASTQLSDVLRQMKQLGLKQEHNFTKIAIQQQQQDLQQIQ